MVCTSKSFRLPGAPLQRRTPARLLVSYGEEWTKTICRIPEAESFPSAAKKLTKDIIASSIGRMQVGIAVVHIFLMKIC